MFTPDDRPIAETIVRLNASQHYIRYLKSIASKNIDLELALLQFRVNFGCIMYYNHLYLELNEDSMSNKSCFILYCLLKIKRYYETAIEQTELIHFQSNIHNLINIVLTCMQTIKQPVEFSIHLIQLHNEIKPLINDGNMPENLSIFIKDIQQTTSLLMTSLNISSPPSIIDCLPSFFNSIVLCCCGKNNIEVINNTPSSVELSTERYASASLPTAINRFSLPTSILTKRLSTSEPSLAKYLERITDTSTQDGLPHNVP